MCGLFRAFTVVCREQLPTNAKILGGRFVIAIKSKETNAPQYKAHFVVESHTDHERNLLIKNSPAVRKQSICLLLATASIFRFHLWIQIVSQTYPRSAQKIIRAVFFKAPA